MQGCLRPTSRLPTHRPTQTPHLTPRCAPTRPPPPRRPRPAAALPSLPPYSDSDSSDEPLSSTSSRCDVDVEALAAAERAIAAQQAAGLPPPYDLASTKKIVETAMLAAVAGLAYSLAVLLKLEGYLSYVLPLPIVLAALRGGVGAAVKCLAVAFLLLFILMGPFRAVAYLLMYGLLSLAMGASAALRLPWAVGVPLGAAARVAGILAYFALSSVMTSENLLAITLHNMHAMLDQFAAFTGGAGAPSLSAVAVTLASLLLVNATFYVFMMSLLYTLVLRMMGYQTGKEPKFVERLMGTSTPSTAF